MKIQPINNVSCRKNTGIRNASKSKQSQVVFKNYGEAMLVALDKDMRIRSEISNVFGELTRQLMKEPGTVKMPAYEIFKDWLITKPTYLVEELCKPTPKMKSEFRDIFFKSRDENVPILKCDENNQLYIFNLGKHGFWNSVFENESARNDVKLVFASQYGTFELGTTDDCELLTEQYFRSGFWRSNKYDAFSGLRVSSKTGNASDPVIWAPF